MVNFSFIMGRGNYLLPLCVDNLADSPEDKVMGKPQIVLDTNVLVSALRSLRGASHRLLLLVGSGRFDVNLSVSLVLEYEEACKRLLGPIPLTAEDIEAVIDYLCQVSQHWQVFFLWRPFLKDPSDDMVLELAVTAGCDCIVTFNKADFHGADTFGLRVLTPKEFLIEIGDIP